MNQNWFKCACYSCYPLTVAIKSFGSDYLVMVLAQGIDNTPGSPDPGPSSQMRPGHWSRAGLANSPDKFQKKPSSV